MGSIVYYANKTQITKLEPRGKLGILVRYNNINYKVLDTETRRVIQTRDTRILENNFITLIIILLVRLIY